MSDDPKGDAERAAMGLLPEEPSLSERLLAAGVMHDQLQGIEDAVVLWLRGWVGATSSSADIAFITLANDLEEGHA